MPAPASRAVLTSQQVYTPKGHGRDAWLKAPRPEGTAGEAQVVSLAEQPDGKQSLGLRAPCEGGPRHRTSLGRRHFQLLPERESGLLTASACRPAAEMPKTG